MKIQFRSDFDFSVPGSKRLHNVIHKLRKWIKILEAKTKVGRHWELKCLLFLSISPCYNQLIIYWISDHAEIFLNRGKVSVSEQLFIEYRGGGHTWRISSSEAHQLLRESCSFYAYSSSCSKAQYRREKALHSWAQWKNLSLPCRWIYLLVLSRINISFWRWWTMDAWLNQEERRGFFNFFVSLIQVWKSGKKQPSANSCLLFLVLWQFPRKWDW